ncbi:LysR family transcriptional regulator [Marinobacter xestospongiae]|uniref:LysR family transcriptional regulator n=1 Tax=Marinobacter xestospongiae TaxID=994319 RepID=UPI00200609C3|nr:LysR family transcriptional regulator [Marinobacter xestospongiae]MCK7567770.1 LysR family transcriptional regulator [Marinobacter xestospongiae]
MDRLKGLEYYKRIVELGSFTAVAEEFGCSNAVISKYVRFLEDWTGARLVNRNTRTISITEEGQSFYDYCVGVLSNTARVMDDLRQDDRAGGQLVVACPVSMSLTILAPVLFRFQQAHPELVVRLRQSDAMTDLISEGVDLAIRATASLDDSALVAIAVGTMPRCLVAAPDYLARHGTPTTLEELGQHRCLIFSLSQDSQHWQFGEGETAQTVAVSGPLVSDNSLMLVEAACHGLGIVLVPRGYVSQQLASGELVALDLQPEPVSRTIYAVYPDRRHLPQRVRLFIDFLKTELAATVAAP